MSIVEHFLMFLCWTTFLKKSKSGCGCHHGIAFVSETYETVIQSLKKILEIQIPLKDIRKALKVARHLQDSPYYDKISLLT